MSVFEGAKTAAGVNGVSAEFPQVLRVDASRVTRAIDVVSEISQSTISNDAQRIRCYIVIWRSYIWERRVFTAESIAIYRDGYFDLAVKRILLIGSDELLSLIINFLACEHTSSKIFIITYVDSRNI